MVEYDYMLYPVWCVPFASLAPTWTACCMLLLWLKYCMHTLWTWWRLAICWMLVPHEEPLNIKCLCPVIPLTSLRSNNKDCTEAVCLYSSQCECLYRGYCLAELRRYWSQSWLPLVTNPHQHYSPALLLSSIGPVARKHTHEHLLSPPEIKDLAPTANW